MCYCCLHLSCVGVAPNKASNRYRSVFPSSIVAIKSTVDVQELLQYSKPLVTSFVKQPISPITISKFCMVRGFGI